MIKVEYHGKFDAVEIEHPAGAWTTVVRGEPVSLPNRVAEGLLEQVDNWRRADDPPSTVVGSDVVGGAG